MARPDFARQGLDPAEIRARSNSSFRDLVEALGGDYDSILDVGAGGFVGATTTVHLLDLFPNAQLTAVELNPARADALRERFGERIAVFSGDILDYSSEEKFGLIVIDLDSPALPFVFERLLFEVLLPLARPGGLIITNLILDFVNAYHGRQPVAGFAEAGVAAFMLRRFGKLLLTDARVKRAFASQDELVPLVTVEKWRGHRDNMMGWTAFRALPPHSDAEPEVTVSAPFAGADTRSGLAATTMLPWQ